MARFRTVQLARRAAAALRELARAHEAFLASPEGHDWIVANDYFGGGPTPPLREFGSAHGFDWNKEDEGLWWEEDGCGAPVLSAGAVGDSVVVYHPYCMGLPETPFRQYFLAVGAVEFGYWQYDRPSVIIEASGANSGAAIESLRAYLALVQAAKHPSEVNALPPWGNECLDSRVLDDEDRSTRLSHGKCSAEVQAERLRLVLSFENTFAGALTVEKWLREAGFTDIQVSVDDRLNPLMVKQTNQVVPQIGLFETGIPLSERLKGASNEGIVSLLFNYHVEGPAILMEAVRLIPIEDRVALCRAEWQRQGERGIEAHRQALRIIQEAGPMAADWMRTLWKLLPEDGFQAMTVAIRSLAAALPRDEAFGLACSWLRTASDHIEFANRIMAFGHLAHHGTLSLIEEWWSAAAPGVPVRPEWGRLASESQFTWKKAADWLEAGRPLSLVSLSALEQCAQRELHNAYEFPSIAEFRSALREYAKRDNVPRVTSAVQRLIQVSTKLAK